MAKIKKFNSENDIISSEINNEMIKGIKMFGKYTFEDKGPSEVMNLDKYDNILKDKSIEDVAYILNTFYDIAKNKKDAISVIFSLISNLDNRDDFEDLWNFDKHKIFEY